MELGVDKILLAKVGITSLLVKTLMMAILCTYTLLNKAPNKIYIPGRS